jgi:hypothetical protein
MEINPDFMPLTVFEEYAEEISGSLITARSIWMN